MTDEERLKRHLAQIRKFSSKVIVVVDPDTQRDPGVTSDKFHEIAEAGYPSFVHHMDLGDSKSYSCILYAEFDSEAEAALFKLKYL